MKGELHQSYWRATTSADDRTYPQLQQNVQADVAIIGAGITGLTAALRLKEMGKRVVVLEGEQVGAGTTGATTGHLDATTDYSLARLIVDVGATAAATITTATREAIDHIALRSLPWPDCEFLRVPSYQYTESASGLDALQKQCAAARQLGFNSWFSRQVPLPFHCVGAVQTTNQGRLHSLHYLKHLAELVDGGGSAVYERTRADIPQDGVPCVVETPFGRVVAEDVFVATHSPYLGISQFDFRVFPYQSYVIAVRVAESIADGIFWDDADPYHYIRLASSADPNLLLIGGADHKTGRPGDERERFAELRQFVQERFTIQAIEHEWSGEYHVPADGLPHVGKAPTTEHLYMATGFAGTGLTWGTAAGLLVAKLIARERHPLAPILEPGRVTLLSSATTFVSENLDALRRFTLDRIGVATTPDDLIPPGTGQVVFRNGQQMAVYRDPSGAYFRCSAVCTHAGCIVHWNQAESTWDCPCHGGRYTAEGRRFYGPPARDLEPVSLPNIGELVSS